MCAGKHKLSRLTASWTTTRCSRTARQRDPIPGAVRRQVAQLRLRALRGGRARCRRPSGSCSRACRSTRPGRRRSSPHDQGQGHAVHRGQSLPGTTRPRSRTRSSTDSTPTWGSRENETSLPQEHGQAGGRGRARGLHRLGHHQARPGRFLGTISRPLLHGRRVRGEHRRHGRGHGALRKDPLHQHHRHLPHAPLLRAGAAGRRPAQAARSPAGQRGRGGLRAARPDAPGERGHRDSARHSPHVRRRPLRRRGNGAPDAADPEVAGPDVHPFGQGRRQGGLPPGTAVRDRQGHPA